MFKSRVTRSCSFDSFSSVFELPYKLNTAKQKYSHDSYLYKNFLIFFIKYILSYCILYIFYFN